MTFFIKLEAKRQSKGQNGLNEKKKTVCFYNNPLNEPKISPGRDHNTEVRGFLFHLISKTLSYSQFHPTDMAAFQIAEYFKGT